MLYVVKLGNIEKPGHSNNKRDTCISHLWWNVLICPIGLNNLHFRCCIPIVVMQYADTIDKSNQPFRYTLCSNKFKEEEEEELTLQWQEPWWRYPGRSHRQQFRWQKRVSSQSTLTRSLSPASRSTQTQSLENRTLI